MLCMTNSYLLHHLLKNILPSSFSMWRIYVVGCHLIYWGINEEVSRWYISTQMFRVHIHLEIFQCSVHYKSYLRFSKPNSCFLYILLELKELQVLKWDGVVGRVLELVLKLESQTFGQTHLLSQVRFSI